MKRPASTRSAPATNGSPILSPRMKTEKSAPKSGVMKALGCELGNIRTMFLLESSTIGFIGGLIGLIISLIASFVLNHLSVLGQGFDLSGMMGGGYYMGGDGSAAISIIPPWLMLAALVFATLVGLVAGILPANKAVKISALEAIRHD